MRAVSIFRAAIQAVVAGAVLVGAAQAADWNAKDLDGAKDHPLIHRFAGSWLVGYKQIGFDATVVPTQFGLEGMNELIKPLTVEGQITRLLYLAPVGKRPYEVQKNYVTALKAAGYKETLSCAGEDKCESTSYGLDDGMDEMTILDFRRATNVNPALKDVLANLDNGGNIFGEHGKMQQMSVGTISAGGKTAHVLVSTDKHFSGDVTITYIQIVQPEDMPLGQVSVDLNGLQSKDKIASEISAQGKVAIYGVYFDTGKADIKPESKAQLTEMGKYLQENRDKKVFIVGHTDNQGTFAANMKLSLDRAKAVAAYLTKEYAIDAARMAAQGVANLAPVGSNKSDDGKAKNRRVELVEQ
ncbi:OmpA family protein [Permianibacter sp. IMCC34836]|uniref:OmpA family protein n=1 Tax=Permianibacter fluminis TaxID=2738515 RepID=UPI00155394B9|nr:OmpA family protein [Permianibacter fluminis]NQD37181.1 OmpA family protein [Permianibacter fluminis]